MTISCYRGDCSYVGFAVLKLSRPSRLFPLIRSTQVTYSSPQAPTAPAPASAPTTTVAPAPTDGSGYDGSDGADYEDDSDASSGEDTGDDSYCDEVGGDYELVLVTSQSQPQPQSSTPAPEPTAPPTEPEPTITTEPDPITTTEPDPTTTAPDNNNNSGNNDVADDAEVHTGGIATWYARDGSPGACGGINSDDELVGAIAVTHYGDVSGRASFCIFAFC